MILLCEHPVATAMKAYFFGKRNDRTSIGPVLGSSTCGPGPKVRASRVLHPLFLEEWDFHARFRLGLGPAYPAHFYFVGWPVQALLGRGLSTGRPLTLGRTQFPLSSAPPTPPHRPPDSIANLPGRMWNCQRLTPITRGDVSGVEPANAGDQRSRDRRDRCPFAQIPRLLSFAEEAQYPQTKRYRA
jgi:hypothetical protein